MDLAAVLIVMGTLMAATLFLTDKYLHYNTIQTRRRLLVKFQDVRVKSIKLHNDIEQMVTYYNHNLTGYDDNEYLEVIKRKDRY